MLERWIESHVEAILARYADIRRGRRQDDRAPAEISELMRPVVGYLPGTVRGERRWEDLIARVVDAVLSSERSSAAVVAEAPRVTYEAICELLEERREPARDAWRVLVAEQMLSASEAVGHALDRYLSGVVAERRREADERERLQAEVIAAQQAAIRELSTPLIPVLDGIVVMPIVGAIDTRRAQDILRALLAGIREHRASVVIVDVTGVTVMDTGVVNHLTRAILAARLKGARTIVTGLSDAAAETIVEMGVDFSGIETLSDLQTGLTLALQLVGLELRSTRRGLGQA